MLARFARSLEQGGDTLAEEVVDVDDDLALLRQGVAVGLEPEGS